MMHILPMFENIMMHFVQEYPTVVGADLINEDSGDAVCKMNIISIRALKEEYQGRQLMEILFAVISFSVRRQHKIT